MFDTLDDRAGGAATDTSSRPGDHAARPIWQFTTDDVAACDRPDYWRHAIGQALNVDVTVQPLPGMPFDMRLSLQDWTCLRLLSVRGSAHRALRRGPGRGDGVSLVLQFSGVCEFGDRRRKVTLGPGDAALMPPDFEHVIAPRGAYSHVLIDLPWQIMDDLLPPWRSLSCHTLPAAHPMAAAMVDLTRWMLQHGDALPDDGRASLAHSLTSLVPSLAEAGAALPARPTRKQLGPLARAQGERIEAFVRENLGESSLDVGRIAHELGLSTRYVHKLYAAGPGVMQWVLECRLQAAREELAQRGARSVSSIAYGLGFTSPSHFSRAFRRRFGMRPTQI